MKQYYNSCFIGIKIYIYMYYIKFSWFPHDVYIITCQILYIYNKILYYFKLVFQIR